MAVSGDLAGVHVETDCCTSCGVPWHYAPEIFREGEQGCLVMRQPRTATEVRRVLRVFQIQDLNCVRYGGSDARVLALLERTGCADSGEASSYPVRATPPRPPAGLRSVLLVATCGSAVTLLGGFSSLARNDWLVSIDAVIGAAGLLLTWGAWHRRMWALRGFLGLAGFAFVLGVIGFITGRRMNWPGSLLLVAVASALFSMRRWYSRPAT